MEQQVQFQRIVRNTKTSYLPSTYEFRVDRKYHWLQKFALWILRKLRCNACHLEESVRYDVVDTQNLMKNLIEQQQEIVNFCHRYSGHVLLVGPGEFSDLCALNVDHPLSIDLQYIWAEPDRNDYRLPPQYTRCALKVVVIPWMKGYLVVPEDLDR